VPILVVDHLKKEKNKMAKFNYKKWITENKYGIISEQTGSMTGSMTGSISTGSMTGSMSTGSMTTGSMAQGMSSMMKKRPQKRMPQRRRPTRGLEEQPSLMKRRAQMAKRRMPTAKTPQGSPKMSKGLREIKEFIKKQVKKLNEQDVAPVGPTGMQAQPKVVAGWPCDSTWPGGDAGHYIGYLTVNGNTPQKGQIIYKPIELGGFAEDYAQWQSGINQYGVSKWRITHVSTPNDYFFTSTGITTHEDVFNTSCYHPINPYTGTLENYDVAYNCAPLNPNSVDGCLEVPKYLGGNNPNMPNPDAVYDTLEDCIAAGCSSEGLDACTSDQWVNLTQDQEDLFCSLCDPSNPNASLMWHCPCCPGDGPIPIKSKGKAPMGKAPMGTKPMMENRKRNYKAFKNHIRKNFKK
jgi:hypothetical protein